MRHGCNMKRTRLSSNLLADKAEEGICRMSKRLIVAAAGLAFISSSIIAKAENNVPFPDYDISKICRRSQSANTAQTRVSNYCMEQQQTAYDDARKAWPQLSQEGALRCAALIKKQQVPTYDLLWDCLKMEKLNSLDHPFHKW